MSERERATGECVCGEIIYGPGIHCYGCRISLKDWREDVRPRDVRDEGSGGKR